MKKIFLILAMTVMAFAAANAKSASEIRVYINPGHGAWTGEDRPMALVNKDIMDTTGFFESNTNLKVGLAMWEKLKEYGLTYGTPGNALYHGTTNKNNVWMSHVKNGPYPSDGNTYGAYSRSLSEIAIECHTNNFDMFISPHSNAYQDGAAVNYPLILFRGTDGNERSAGSIAMAQAMWPFAYSDSHQQWSATSTYNSTTPNIRGDVTFMGGDYSTNINGTLYWGYYGVLRQGTPGFLIERYFHTYRPARHRAMNWEADYIQGYNLARGVAAYFGLTPSTSTGEIFGVVRSASEISNYVLYGKNSNNDSYSLIGADDAKMPLNGVTVTLKNSSGTVVNTQQINQNGTASTVSSKTTDSYYNGVFVFRGLAAGNYTVTLSKSGYDTQTINVTVEANKTTYPSVFMNVSGQSVDPYDPGTGYYNYYDDKMAGGWPINPRLNYNYYENSYYDNQPDKKTDSWNSGRYQTLAVTSTNTQHPHQFDNRNSFAYDVATEMQGNSVNVRYRLSGTASSVTVYLYKEDGTTLVTSKSGTTNPSNTVNIPLSSYSDGVYKVKVAVTGTNRGWVKVKSFKFYAPTGVTCNNCTESPTFGRVLVLEGMTSTSDIDGNPTLASDGYHSGVGSGSYGNSGFVHGSGCGMGIYAFTPQGIPLFANPAASNVNEEPSALRNYYGFFAGLTANNEQTRRPTDSFWTSRTDTDFGRDFKRIKYSDDGRLFLARTTKNSSASALYELNPNNLNATATNVFAGSSKYYFSQQWTGANGSGALVCQAIVGLDVFGAGPNLKIATVMMNMKSSENTVNNDPNFNKSNVAIYNLGTARSWNAAPSISFPEYGTESAADRDWQNWGANVAMRGDCVITTQIPGDQSGHQYSRISFTNNLGSRIERQQIANANGGGIAWNKDRTKLAVVTGKGIVTIYRVTPSGSSITYTNYYSSNSSCQVVNAYSSHICALAWDYADNLYVTSNSGESFDCWSTPRNSDELTVTTPAAEYYDIHWKKPVASNPSANYYVAEVSPLWVKSLSGVGARSFGLTAGTNSDSKTKNFYFLSNAITKGQPQALSGHFAGFNCAKTDWTAAASSNEPGNTYYYDFDATSDDAGNLFFLGTKSGSTFMDQEMLASGCGQGATRAIIIPATSGGINQASIAANQSRTFNIGQPGIVDRTQFVYATGDFSSSSGGSYWLVPYGGSVIHKGGFRNVTLSGGERITSQYIPTGLGNSPTNSSAWLNSITPYLDTDGGERALVCMTEEALYDGYIADGRYYPVLQISNVFRNAQGKPSMFVIQDRKILVCGSGNNGTETMGLFEITNDANGNVTKTQIGSNFAPFGNASVSQYLRGPVTRTVAVDDLTTDIYVSSSGNGLAVYRVRLEPEPVVTVSTQVINNYTSQSKKISWTTKANTSPIGFLIEVSTDNGATWTTISSPQPRSGGQGEGDPNNIGSMREYIDTDASRATLDCQYRISAIYNSFTSNNRHTAIPKNQTVSKVVPSKGVTFQSSQCLFKQLKTGTGMYNGSATSSAYDLYGLTGSFTWIHPQKINNTSLFNDKINNVEESAGHDYGFDLVGYKVTIKEKNSNVYLKMPDNRTLNDLYLSMSEIGSPGSNGKYHYVENVPGLKRGVQYTYTVTPVYKYQGAGSEYLGAAMSYDTPAWDYSPEPVKNLTVDTYFQADAPREEWWGDRATGHAQTVYYDIYRVEITMDDPNYVNSPGGWSSSASSSYKVYPSFHKVEVNKGNGVWVPLTDMPYEYLSGADGAVISTYPNQAGVNCSYNRTFTKDGFGYFMGGNFGSNYNYSYGTYSFNNHRKKPDEGFSKDVNIGFYYFICNGANKAHSLGHIATPRATGEKTPDQWEYRVTSYYGSSSTVQSSGTNYTPDPSFADSAVATASSGAPVITGVEAPTFQADGLRVYPNPTQGELNLASNEPIQSIRIVSIAGALMRSIDGNYQNAQTIDISSLVAGNYFVIVNSQKPVHVIKR